MKRQIIINFEIEEDNFKYNVRNISFECPKDVPYEVFCRILKNCYNHLRKI
jgi:hypothetical protein